MTFLYLFILLGKTFYLPVASALSFQNDSYARRLDLFLMVADYVKTPSNNSRVLACHRGYWNTACIAGSLTSRSINGNRRVIQTVTVENGGGTVGIPLNGDFIVYSTVLIIPRELWITLHVSSLSIIFATLVKKLVKERHRMLGERHVATPSTLIIILINALIIGPSYVDQTFVKYTAPGVAVSTNFSLRDSAVFVNVDTSGMYRLVDARCYLVNYNSSLQRWFNNENRLVSNNDKRELETLLLNETSVKINIPYELYYELYNASKLVVERLLPINLSVRTHVNLGCELRLDKGSLRVKVSFSFNWEDLYVRLMDGRVVISNPNPLPLRVRIILLERDAPKVIVVNETTVERLTRVEFPLDRYGDVGLVIVHYELLGLKRVKVIENG